MKGSAMTNNLVLIKSPSRVEVDGASRVEFSVDGLDIAHQFRIWTKSSTYMCILIRENSGLVPQLKVGDVLNLKCYYSDSYYPSEYLETAILHITKKDEGRFKDQYVVGLEILGSQNWDKTH